jgi:hypothetical protein
MQHRKVCLLLALVAFAFAGLGEILVAHSEVVPLCSYYAIEHSLCTGRDGTRLVCSIPAFDCIDGVGRPLRSFAVAIAIILVTLAWAPSEFFTTWKYVTVWSATLLALVIIAPVNCTGMLCFTKAEVTGSVLRFYVGVLAIAMTATGIVLLRRLSRQKHQSL